MDTTYQVDNIWLLNIQRKLYQWSVGHPDEAFRELWNWVTDSRNLRLAYGRVATNTGRNTPGIDGMTIAGIEKEKGREKFLSSLREQLRNGHYRPKPVRRKWIPKPGKPGQLRGLGIPTIEDRVIQSAIKQIIEPIFEARFLPVSHGFRPGHAVRDAVEHIRMMLRGNRRISFRKKPPYEYVIEGDIKSCFDQIDHHALMVRVRRAISDLKVNRLIMHFLKAGILEELRFSQTSKGTPQGGILSPLLANIALSMIEERYRRWVHPERVKFPPQQAAKNRIRDIIKNRPVFFPIRYADDFILLVYGTKEQIVTEKQELEIFLKKELGLVLSEEKTKITALTEGFNFLGHRIQLRENPNYGWMLNPYIPPEAKARFRRKIKRWTCRDTSHRSLEWVLDKINPIIEGWGNFYRYTSWAWKTFGTLDQFVFHRVERWLKKKHPKLNSGPIYRRYYGRAGKGNQLRWYENTTYCSRLLEIKREGWWDMRKRRLPQFMFTIGEPGT